MESLTGPVITEATAAVSLVAFAANQPIGVVTKVPVTIGSVIDKVVCVENCNKISSFIAWSLRRSSEIIKPTVVTVKTVTTPFVRFGLRTGKNAFSVGSNLLRNAYNSCPSLYVSGATNATTLGVAVDSFLFASYRCIHGIISGRTFGFR